MKSSGSVADVIPNLTAGKNFVLLTTFAGDSCSFGTVREIAGAEIGACIPDGATKSFKVTCTEAECAKTIYNATACAGTSTTQTIALGKCSGDLPLFTRAAVFTTTDAGTIPSAILATLGKLEKLALDEVALYTKPSDTDYFLRRRSARPGSCDRTLTGTYEVSAFPELQASSASGFEYSCVDRARSDFGTAQELADAISGSYPVGKTFLRFRFFAMDAFAQTVEQAKDLSCNYRRLTEEVIIRAAAIPAEADVSKSPCWLGARLFKEATGNYGIFLYLDNKCTTANPTRMVIHQSEHGSCLPLLPSLGDSSPRFTVDLVNEQPRYTQVVLNIDQEYELN